MRTELVIGDLKAQPLLHLPTQWMNQFDPPFSNKPSKDMVVTFKELGVKMMELRVVERKRGSLTRQYKIVRHNGGIWVSVPRPWLRDQSAAPGDVIEISWGETTAILSLIRSKDRNEPPAPDPDAAHTDIHRASHRRTVLHDLLSRRRRTYKATQGLRRGAGGSGAPGREGAGETVLRPAGPVLRRRNQSRGGDKDPNPAD